MAELRFTSGGATVTIDGMDEVIRRTVERMENATMAAAETLVDEVANSARGQWYTLVNKESGKSGDIVSRVTVDADREQIHAQIVSRDDRRASGVTKRSIPVPLLVHTSGYSRASTKKQVTHAEYWKAPKDRRGRYHPSDIDRAEGITGPFVWTGPAPVKSTTGAAGTHTSTSSGIYLAAALVIKPANARVKALPAELRLAFARARRPRRKRG